MNRIKRVIPIGLIAVFSITLLFQQEAQGAIFYDERCFRVDGVTHGPGVTYSARIERDSETNWRVRISGGTSAGTSIGNLPDEELTWKFKKDGVYAEYTYTFNPRDIEIGDSMGLMEVTVPIPGSQSRFPTCVDLYKNYTTNIEGGILYSSAYGNPSSVTNRYNYFGKLDLPTGFEYYGGFLGSNRSIFIVNRDTGEVKVKRDAEDDWTTSGNIIPFRFGETELEPLGVSSQNNGEFYAIEKGGARVYKRAKNDIEWTYVTNTRGWGGADDESLTSVRERGYTPSSAIRSGNSASYYMYNRELRKSVRYNSSRDRWESCNSCDHSLPPDGLNYLFRVDTSDFWMISGPLESSSPNIPALVSPINNSYSRSKTVAISWNYSHPSGVQQESFMVQTSQYSNFAGATLSGEISSTNPTYTLTNLPEGNNYIRVMVKDKNGNWSEWSDSIKITVDTIPPTSPSITITY